LLSRTAEPNEKDDDRHFTRAELGTAKVVHANASQKWGKKGTFAAILTIAKKRKTGRELGKRKRKAVPSKKHGKNLYMKSKRGHPLESMPLKEVKNPSQSVDQPRISAASDEGEPFNASSSMSGKEGQEIKDPRALTQELKGATPSSKNR